MVLRFFLTSNPAVLTVATLCLWAVLTRQRFYRAFSSLFTFLLGLHFLFSPLFQWWFTILRKEQCLFPFWCWQPIKASLYFIQKVICLMQHCKDISGAFLKCCDPAVSRSPYSYLERCLLFKMNLKKLKMSNQQHSHLFPTIENRVLPQNYRNTCYMKMRSVCILSSSGKSWEWNSKHV